MQGALVSARFCGVRVFANTEAGESDAALSAPFRPGKPQEWRSYAECRQAACVNLLESAHFCVSGGTHRAQLQEASMTTEYESQFVNAPAQEVNAFERGESLRIGAESVIVDPAVPTEARKEACELDVAGKYEPQLRENGIPADVLEKLLPGDDVVELAKPIVAGGLGYRFVKRAFDVCSTGCVLIILAIPMGIIALKIKSESPGPVIYAQERVGKNGKPFMVYKFRSMYVDAEKRGAQWAQGDDPRVTPFGKVMRKTRLDEIPQFWSVFKGDIPLRILKMRSEFSEKSMGAFALPAKSSTNKEKAFSQVVSCFAIGLRMRRISECNCNRIDGMEPQFLAKPVFGVSPVHTGALFHKPNNGLAKAAW